jgi:hypothetical protein
MQVFAVAATAQPLDGSGPTGISSRCAIKALWESELKKGKTAKYVADRISRRESPGQICSVYLKMMHFVVLIAGPQVAVCVAGTLSKCKHCRHEEEIRPQKSDQVLF